jgi:hypothetical protein
VADIPVVAVCETPFYGINLLLKRLSDIVLSSLILLMIAPIMLAVAIAVKMSSPGPMLFKQRRYGLDGEGNPGLQVPLDDGDRRRRPRWCQATEKRSAASPGWVHLSAAPRWMSCRSSSMCWKVKHEHRWPAARMRWRTTSNIAS